MRTPSVWIKEAAEMIAASPLAVSKENAMKPLASESARISSELSQPVRVAVLGEVKAGKSTLINAIIGQKVAPTDVLEATAVTQYFRHGTGKASVTYMDGRIVQMTAEELFKLLDDHKRDEKFAGSIEKVELALALPGLETLQILDTPGLTSMTEVLSRKALDELGNFDVIVWVLSAHHSGAEDVLKAFDQVAGTGRPIIAVINRVDELANGGIEAVLKQFEDRLEPWNVEAILPVSAKLAFEGRDGGIGPLRKKLEVFASAPDETKLKSACAQMDVILHSSAELHLAREESARAAMEKREILRQRLIRAGQSVLADINYKASYYIHTELFKTEYEALKKNAENSNDNSMQNKMKEVFANFESRMLTEIQPALLAKISKLFEEGWRREGHAIDEDIKAAGLLDGAGATHTEAARAHIGEIQRAFGDLNMDHVWEPVVRETAVWTGAGTALAAYAAWFGANAAAVSIGAALGAMVPPLAFAGVTVGLVKTYFDQRGKLRKRVALIDEAFHKLRGEIEDKLWNQTLYPVLEKINADVLNKMFAEQHLLDVITDPESLSVWADQAETFRRLSPFRSNLVSSTN